MSTTDPAAGSDNVRYGPMSPDTPDVEVPEGTPTQVAHPARATLRTVVVVIITTLLLLVAIAPEVIAAVLEEPAITGTLRAVLAATAGALTAVAAALQRIALIPGVNAAIERYLPWLATGVHTEVDAVLGDRPQGRHARID